jgi:predicted HTH domain antitoxin
MLYFLARRTLFRLSPNLFNLSIEDFLDILKETDIDVVDYPEHELDKDLENIVCPPRSL